MCRMLRWGLMLAFPAIAGGIPLGVTLWGPAHLEAVTVGSVALVWAAVGALAVACGRPLHRAP